MSAVTAKHDEVVVEMLRRDPAMAGEYLRASLGAVNEQGGEQALLDALRHIARAQGMAALPPRRSVHRATHNLEHRSGRD